MKCTASIISIRRPACLSTCTRPSPTPCAIRTLYSPPRCWADTPNFCRWVYNSFQIPSLLGYWARTCPDSIKCPLLQGRVCTEDLPPRSRSEHQNFGGLSRLSPQERRYPSHRSRLQWTHQPDPQRTNPLPKSIDRMTALSQCVVNPELPAHTSQSGCAYVGPHASQSPRLAVSQHLVQHLHLTAGRPVMLVGKQSATKLNSSSNSHNSSGTVPLKLFHLASILLMFLMRASSDGIVPVK